jgi:hypothetical protein
MINGKIATQIDEKQCNNFVKKKGFELNAVSRTTKPRCKVH